MQANKYIFVNKAFSNRSKQHNLGGKLEGKGLSMYLLQFHFSNDMDLKNSETVPSTELHSFKFEDSL